MIIRQYHSRDCKEITELFYNTVHTVNAKDYTKEQLDAWATGQVDLELWDQSLQAHFSLVAMDAGIIVGFGDIDPTGYLDRLFVHPDYQGLGIASALCDQLEAAVEGAVVTHASITAKPFFEKRGYRLVKAQQVERQDVFLTNYVMVKERPHHDENEKISSDRGTEVTKRYEILDLHYSFGETQQHLSPVVLFGQNDLVLVDCGYPGSLDMLEREFQAHGLELSAVTKLVLTHQDDDHMGAAAELKRKYPAVEIMVSPVEAPYLSGALKNLRLQQGEALQSQLPEDMKEFGEQFCERFRQLKPVQPDRLLKAGERFDWGGGCEILATPGHTPGHISIRALDNSFLIAGDAAVIEENKLVIANPEFCLDMAAARDSLEKILQYHCGQYICYHGGCLN